MNFSIQDLFWYGMDRKIPELLEAPPGPQLNIAPGRKKEIPHTIGIGYETGWHAPSWLVWPEGLAQGGETIADGTVAAIHCYHFLEHLSGQDAIWMLREFDRVLAPGGVLYVVVPYYNSNLMAHALDHKSFWCEDTWKWLLDQEYYDDFTHGWNLTVHACFIMGIVERNMALLTQLVKGAA